MRRRRIEVSYFNDWSWSRSRDCCFAHSLLVVRAVDDAQRVPELSAYLPERGRFGSQIGFIPTAD